MKTDALPRACGGLSDKERAGLAFAYACRGDELELACPMDKLPKIALTGPSPEYARQVRRLPIATMRRSAERWRLYARRQASLGEIATRQSIEPEAVRRVAECGRLEALFVEAPEAEHVEAAKVRLIGLLEGRKRL